MYNLCKASSSLQCGFIMACLVTNKCSDAHLTILVKRQQLLLSIILLECDYIGLLKKVVSHLKQAPQQLMKSITDS